MTTIPADARKPQDRKPKAAVVAEGSATAPAPIPFNYNGTDYTLDPQALDDLDIMEALEDQRMVAFLRMILGDAQYATMKAQLREEHNGRIPGDAVGTFVETMFGAVDPTGRR